jgi:low affinity Fe/Cu permease
MSERRRDEKEEKQEEKDEKSRGEKWRRDPLSAAIWAGILIWAGLALLAGNLGLLAPFEWLEPWSLVFLGAGLIVLLEAAIRLSVPAYRRPVGGTVIVAIILMAIGLGDLVSWGVVWALVLIVGGVIILLQGLGWRR